MSNTKKSATLGMPHGTAANRLRKLLLFDALKRHAENRCYRCHKLIYAVEDLSIEHIKPWEGVSADLFWDLSNVAFSHLRCNVPHSYQGGVPLRKVGPEGTAWCTGCKKFESVEKFCKSETRWNGLQKYCRYSRPDR